MKQYGRRDFLKALGIGTAALAVADHLTAKALHPRGDPSLFPREFAWEFFGETELPAYVSHMEDANLIALAAEAPPEGYSFFARGIRLSVREDARLQDIGKFLESWSMSLKLGDVDQFTGAAVCLMSWWGTAGRPMDLFPLVPQLRIPVNRPLQLVVHGKPFPLTGPLFIQASIHGVGIEHRTANASPTAPKLPPEAA